MAYKLYKAVSDNGGGIGVEIFSGEIDALFDELTKPQQLSGVVKNRKIFIESDINKTVYIGIHNAGDFLPSIFTSAGANDEVVDLLGTEDKFTSVVITASTLTGFTYDNTINPYVIFKINQFIVYDSTLHTVGSTVDNGNGTNTVTFGVALTTQPIVGKTITSAIQLTLVAGVPMPFWRRNDYIAGVATSSGYNAVDLLVLD